MLKSRIGTFFNASLLSLFFVLAVIAAAPNMGSSDVPELPRADGSGDTPELMVDLFPTKLGAVAKQAERMKLSSLRGRVVLMDIFWSRCAHCEEHAPHIVEFYNQYRQRGFTVIGIATDRKDDKDDVENLRKFLQKAKINYPVGFLTTEIRAYYADSKNAGVPQMVLFGTDGKMITREIGWNDKIGEKMKKLIEAQLVKAPAMKAPAAKSSPANNKAAPRKTKKS